MRRVEIDHYGSPIPPHQPALGGIESKEFRHGFIQSKLILVRAYDRHQRRFHEFRFPAETVLPREGDILIF